MPTGTPISTLEELREATLNPASYYLTADIVVQTTSSTQPFDLKNTSSTNVFDLDMNYYKIKLLKVNNSPLFYSSNSSGFGYANIRNGMICSRAFNCYEYGIFRNIIGTFENLEFGDISDEPEEFCAVGDGVFYYEGNTEIPVFKNSSIVGSGLISVRGGTHEWLSAFIVLINGKIELENITISQHAEIMDAIHAEGDSVINIKGNINISNNEMTGGIGEDIYFNFIGDNTVSGKRQYFNVVGNCSGVIIVNKQFDGGIPTEGSYSPIAYTSGDVSDLVIYNYTENPTLRSTIPTTQGEFGVWNPISQDEDKVRIKVNDTWKEGTAYIKVNNTWKKGTAYQKVNNVWKKSI